LVYFFLSERAQLTLGLCTYNTLPTQPVAHQSHHTVHTTQLVTGLGLAIANQSAQIRVSNSYQDNPARPAKKFCRGEKNSATACKQHIFFVF
jgi:hypothetical protein